jgi:hypothetical protein
VRIKRSPVFVRDRSWNRECVGPIFDVALSDTKMSKSFSFKRDDSAVPVEASHGFMEVGSVAPAWHPMYFLPMSGYLFSLNHREALFVFFEIRSR